MGATERAQKVEMWQREKAIEKARRAAADLPGPHECVKCGDPNDRFRQGFAVCSECMSGGE